MPSVPPTSARGKTRYRVRFFRRLTGERGILRDGMTRRSADAYARRVEESRPVATDIFVEPYEEAPLK
jgi:hypothetical protein